MELEKLFEFISPDAIRIKGTRVGIEIIIENFLEGVSPEEIVLRYPSLSLEQIYAAVTYYLYNRQEMDAYIDAGRKRVEAAYEQQRCNPPPGIKRLMEHRTELLAQLKASRQPQRGTA